MFIVDESICFSFYVCFAVWCEGRKDTSLWVWRERNGWRWGACDSLGFLQLFFDCFDEVDFFGVSRAFLKVRGAVGVCSGR